jgi:hypothetical protein
VLIHQDGSIEMIVREAGALEVNGVYSQDGYSGKAFTRDVVIGMEGIPCSTSGFVMRVSSNAALSPDC